MISSPEMPAQQNILAMQQGLQSIQFEKKNFQEKQTSQSLAPLTQKAKGESISKKIFQSLIFYKIWCLLASLQNVQKDKGKIHKGPNFDSKRLSTFDKAKMMDLMVILSFLLKISKSEGGTWEQHSKAYATRKLY